MKIALTGAGGMLGLAVQKVFADAGLVSFTRADLDVTKLDDAVKMVRHTAPDLLIHAAAFTDVDACETDPERAYLVNGIGARNMTIACEEVRCPIIYISTDYVFDGLKAGPYNEWDEPNPVNQYGLSKLMGERFVSSLTSRFYIVRTSWLYGRGGRNFVDTVLRLLAQDKPLRVVDDQKGSPTFAEDLASGLRELAGKGYGTYHLTNSGICTWHDLALKIAGIKGIMKEIVPVTTSEFARPAKRPALSALASTMTRLSGMTSLRPWEVALTQYLTART